MRIVQLTDCHLTADRTREKNGVVVATSLSTLLGRLRRGPAIDLVILTGDLADDGKPETYKWLRQEAETLGAPVLALNGNHDTDALREVFPFPAGAQLQSPSAQTRQRAYAIDLEGWRLLLCDSRLDDETAVGGDIHPEQLAFLDTSLSRASGPALAFVHHPPGRTGQTWVDEYGVIGRGFAEVVGRHRQRLRGVFFGHVHGEMAFDVGGVWTMSCPSTGFAYGDGEYLPTKDSTRPLQGGARLIDVEGDRIQTRTFYAVGESYA